MYNRFLVFVCLFVVHLFLHSVTFFYIIIFISQLIKLRNVLHYFLQGTFQYQLIGLYPANQYFSIDGTTGIIRIINQLRNDPLHLMSYTVSLGEKLFIVSLKYGSFLESIILVILLIL